MRILLAEDEKTIRVTLNDALKAKGHEVTIVKDGQQALNQLQRQDFDAAVLDVKMPGLDGMEVLKRIKPLKPDLAIIMITGYGSVESAVAAVKSGAYDYLEKPFPNEEIILILEKVQQYNDLRQAYQQLKEQVTERVSYENLIGKSKKMTEVYQLIDSVAKKDCSVLIVGASGTGKELIANAIHYRSLRKDFPLVKMSCAVFPESLIESELFGHEKGAFTDAKTQKIGRFEMANNGTIFLDDIDDMSPQTQVKLLRVLQEHEFERIGATKTIKVNIRIVVATKSDLLKRVKENSFREDLYYRLNVVIIKMPLLRERTEDIPLLLDHFIKKHGQGKEYKIEPETKLALMNYHWPGNVRELENAVERAIALVGDSTDLKKEHLLKSSIDTSENEGEDKLFSLAEHLEHAETDYLKKVLRLTEGNKGEMARTLQITRKTLWEKLKKYGLE